MPSWKELLEELERQPDDKKKSSWLDSSLKTALVNVRKRRNDRNVIFYASAFLQKAGAPPQLLQITQEELNGLMAVMFGMDFTKGLTLILHTPGGITNAAETLVAYLWSKFDYIEVIVPAFAMSAGTMIAFGTNRVIMGHQSQLGPIDPQLPVGGRFVSARAVVDQYDLGKKEVLNDLRTAHVWAPILQSLGPALLQEALNALQYGEEMVSRWLTQRMFAGDPNAEDKATAVARHFNDASTHKSHGRRIDITEATNHGVVTEQLEADQQLQEHVLTAYHLVTLLFEKGPATKILMNDSGRTWLKNFPMVVQPQPMMMAAPGPRRP